MAHDVDGIWDLVQSNGFRVRVDIVQPRCPAASLTGSCRERPKRSALAGWHR
jgi:hypothetical protein